MKSNFFIEYLLTPLMIFFIVTLFVCIFILILHNFHKNRILYTDEYYHPYFDHLVEKYFLWIYKIDYLIVIIPLIFILFIKSNLIVDMYDVLSSNYYEKKGVVQEIELDNSIIIDNKKYILNDIHKIKKGQNIELIYLKHSKKSILKDCR